MTCCRRGSSFEPVLAAVPILPFFDIPVLIWILPFATLTLRRTHRGTR